VGGGENTDPDEGKVKMQHEGDGNNVLACKDLIDQKRVMSKKTTSPVTVAIS